MQLEQNVTQNIIYIQEMKQRPYDLTYQNALAYHTHST